MVTVCKEDLRNTYKKKVNSNKTTIILPPQKDRKVQQEVMKLTKSTMSARKLAMFIEKAVATSRAVMQASLHFRALKRALNLAIPKKHNCSK